MSLSDAARFFPAYRPVPSWMARSATAISPRFPYNGTLQSGPASGVTGLAGSMITPARSAIEAQNWGATLALWVYTNLAASRGFSSNAAFVKEFTDKGIHIQSALNTSAVNSSTGPFAQDLGGSLWTAGSSGTRPALVSGQQNPLNSRISISVTLMPAADENGTILPKLATAASQMADGCFGMQLDDPRAHAGYSGWRAIAPAYDLTSQGVDFSPTAKAGFTVWLGSNTTSTQRSSFGLPADLTNFDIEQWLRTKYPSVLFGAGQVDPTAIDNYLFRTSLSSNANLRDVILGLYNRYLRDTQVDFTRRLRGALGGGLLSSNLWQASPCEFISGYTRRSTDLFDFAIAETAPDYWSDISANLIGSQAWYAARMRQCARRHMNAAAYDMMGLRAWVEHKPTSLLDAPPRVVRQILRLSNLQSVMEGVSPMPPVDVFMTLNDPKSQGVAVDGYRFWGPRADYEDIWAFIRANAIWIDSYEKTTTTFLAVHNCSFPFQDGASTTRFNLMLDRLAALFAADVDYHFLPVGEADGLLPQDPPSAIEASAPLIIRLQDDSDYYTHLGRLSAPNCRHWSSAAVAEAATLSPLQSTNPLVRATARYDASAGRVSVHLLNLAMAADGTPSPQQTTLRWNWEPPTALANVVRLGETASALDLSSGFAGINLREYAIVNFLVR